MSVDTTPALIASAIVALMYTAVGQLIAVAYTDVVQMIFMVLGMVSGLHYGIYISLYQWTVICPCTLES